MKKKRLKVSNYAKLKDCSVTEVYRMIKDKRVKSEVIDGVKFVIVEDE